MLEGVALLCGGWRLVTKMKKNRLMDSVGFLVSGSEGKRKGKAPGSGAWLLLDGGERLGLSLVLGKEIRIMR